MELVRVEVADGVARVTLDDPGRRNALSTAMVDELTAAFDRLDTDPDVGAASGRTTAYVRGSNALFYADTRPSPASAFGGWILP